MKRGSHNIFLFRFLPTPIPLLSHSYPSRYSLFVIPSWKNRWLVAGVAIPAALHFGLVNGENFGLGSGLGEAFGVVKLSKRHWGKVLLYSAPMLLLDEGLKVIGRRRNSQEEKSRRKARQKSNNQ